MKRYRRPRRLRIPCSLGAALLFQFACSPRPPGTAATGETGPRLSSLPKTNRYDYEQTALGRAFHITLYADSSSRADEAANAVGAKLEELSSKLDAARPDSELARLCAQAGGPWTKVSDELLLLLQQTRRLSELHDGAADVTVGPEADLWRRAFEAGTIPSEDPLDDARAAIGWQKVQIDPIERRVRLLLPTMRVDLDQRAVAYAADRALEELARHGVTGALIDAGDVTAASGAPPGRKGWPVRLPPAGPKGQAQAVELRDQAVVRLGDGARARVIAGRLYSDRVDARTGLGIMQPPNLAGGSFPVATTVTAGKAFPAAQGAALAMTLPPHQLAVLISTTTGVTIQMRPPLPR
jgi:thiamine biosynthesis lipoprotein